MVFQNPKKEGDFKVVIDCYNKKCSLPRSIIILMEDIWRLTQYLNIYNCCHNYREGNLTTNYLTKKDICNTHSNIWW